MMNRNDIKTVAFDENADKTALMNAHVDASFITFFLPI